MSKFTERAAKPDTSDRNVTRKVENFMRGVSFTVDPLSQLRIVATSSIFGEPQYYRSGDQEVSGTLRNKQTFQKYSIFADWADGAVTSADIMTKAINEALDYDFKGTMEFAVELRREFYMRMNPAIIMVLASVHPKRQQFTTEFPGYFQKIVEQVAMRPDDLTSMVEFYIHHRKGQDGKGKDKMPSILKRAIARRLETFTPYQVAKYQNRGIGLIDGIRIVHACGNKNPAINELMQGTLKMPEGQKTWMQLRSEGMSWEDILTNHFDMLSHFDILKQARNMFLEVSSKQLTKKTMNKFLEGVPSGKIFPYRYWIAWQQLAASSIHNKVMIMDTFEEAIDKAISMTPVLKGRTISLSDNSGSAWNGFTSEGTLLTVAEVGNLSAVMTGMSSEEGYVGVFGDRLNVIPVSKRNGALSQLKNISEAGKKIGLNTENGIWIFFKNAIEKKEHWDNMFIYSDMQAGHGGLYGEHPQDYREYLHGSSYIDVMKLVDAYRKKVNPNVNVFSIQTAGYNNSVIPEHIYRGAILGGWTGKEALFASQLIKEWDTIESKN